MNIDDDEPPALVDVSNDSGGGDVEEPKPIRVPITIVTGEYVLDTVIQTAAAVLTHRP